MDATAFRSWREAFAEKHRRRVAGMTGEIAPEVNSELFWRLIFGAAAAGDQALAGRLLAQAFPDARHTSPFVLGRGETLAAWCGRHEIALREVLPATDIAIPATSPYSRPYAYRTDPAVFATLPNARWVAGWDSVIAADGAIIGDVNYMGMDRPHSRRPHIGIEGTGVFGYYAPPAEQFIEADVLYLGGPVENHFGHWMIDFLPRLLGRDLAPPGAKIAVPATLSTKQHALLALWGVNDDDLLLCPDDRTFVFRNLHVYAPGRAMPPNPAHVAAVRARIAAPATRPTSGKRFHLARGAVGTRRIANLESFEALLAEHNIVTLDVGEMSIAAQRDALADAEVLLGAYGSNLLALYFAPPGCTVIGLMDHPEDDPTLPHTCHMLGMKHQFLVCAEAEQAGHWRMKKDKDIVVDCDELRERLRAI